MSVPKCFWIGHADVFGSDLQVQSVWLCQCEHCLFSEAKTSESCPDGKASAGGGFCRRTGRHVCLMHCRPAVEKTGSFCRQSFRTSAECNERKHRRTCISTWSFVAISRGQKAIESPLYGCPATTRSEEAPRRPHGQVESGFVEIHEDANFRKDSRLLRFILTRTVHSLDAGRCPGSRGRRHGEALLAKQNA